MTKKHIKNVDKSRESLFTPEYIKMAVIESKKSILALRAGYELTEEALSHTYNADLSTVLKL